MSADLLLRAAARLEELDLATGDMLVDCAPGSVGAYAYAMRPAAAPLAALLRQTVDMGLAAPPWVWRYLLPVARAVLGEEVS